MSDILPATIGMRSFTLVNFRLLSLLIVSFSMVASVNAVSNFEASIQKLENEISRVTFLSPRLDFADWLQDNHSIKLENLATIKQWQVQLNQLEPAQGCEQLRFDNLQLHLNLLANRTKLLANLQQTAPKPEYSGVMSALPNGKDWYLHWLNSWLLIDGNQPLTVSHISQLKSMAEQELNEAFPQYEALLTTFTQGSLKTFDKADHLKVERALRQRERIVVSNLQSVFGNLPTIPKVNIAKSNLPESFPAPGIYNDTNQTFYYHFTDQHIQAHSLDWLYLHEAIPGHHMQLNISQTSALCPSNKFNVAPLVSAEGWAAYVETLGERLGVYQHPSSLLYAHEWRVLRALRVLMDIGIHYENWSDDQALALWSQYLPQLPNIGQREVARIKRWPVQVITYVYGKHHIQQLLLQFEKRDSKQPHSAAKLQASYLNTILRLSNHPPLSFATVSYFQKRNDSL